MYPPCILPSNPISSLVLMDTVNQRQHCDQVTKLLPSFGCKACGDAMADDAPTNG